MQHLETKAVKRAFKQYIKEHPESVYPGVDPDDSVLNAKKPSLVNPKGAKMMQHLETKAVERAFKQYIKEHPESVYPGVEPDDSVPQLS